MFPSVNTASKDPDGLLAVGGDLSTTTLTLAYRNGIFPWFSDKSPILWWSPSQRCVIKPSDLHISRRLKQKLKQNKFRVTSDEVFEKVIKACASNRKNSDTWITNEMIEAYIQLHYEGCAHSVEVWDDDNLVGGIYGVIIGSIFSGESMFSRTRDGSKVAIAHLCSGMKKVNMPLLDCQIENPHLRSLGAISLKRDDFIKILKVERDRNINWQFQPCTAWDN